MQKLIHILNMLFLQGEVALDKTDLEVKIC